ncbi:hypothetical protein ORM92_23200 [Bacillus cereus]|uniref:hypothetical protein n=1 Tax=Bacillus cereus TaxID=1396 RepID=UPI002AC2E477|nr:hypothetical protein [Bacillus cereus]MDZ4406752.1 hypothetical protein [Bacillus cereus]MDZ4533987.1 hypothetical protein [Bacillus cereus]
MIHQYESDFSVIYVGKVTDLQLAIIPAHPLEEASKKLQLDKVRREILQSAKLLYCLNLMESKQLQN